MQLTSRRELWKDEMIFICPILKFTKKDDTVSQLGAWLVDLSRPLLAKIFKMRIIRN